MSAALQNAVRAQAQALGNTKTFVRTGLVSGYDPARYAIKVMLQPEGYETGWMPLGSTWVGNGWGMFSPPSVGDQIEVAFEGGAHDAGGGGVRFFSLVDVPLQVPSGECWLVHKTGTSIKLTNDGKITLTDAAGSIVQLQNNGTVAITGAVSITGNVTVTGTFTATGEGTFNGGHTVSAHKHGGVAAGAATTATPTG